MVYSMKLTVGPMKSNCYIVYNNDTRKAVIIDPGDESSYIMRILDDYVLFPEHIILTHGHFDHIGAADILAEEFQCDIIMNKNDYHFLGNPILNLSKTYGLNTVVKCQRLTFVGDCQHHYIDAAFGFIHTPGHTPGSMCIAVGNMLFTGDTLFNDSIGRAFPPYGNTEQEIASIKMLMNKIKDDLNCHPGHGLNTTLDKERKYNAYITGDV